MTPNRRISLDKQGHIRLTEAQIQEQIVGFLRAKGCVVLENRSARGDSLLAKYGNKSAVGSPDLVVALPKNVTFTSIVGSPDIHTFWIEVKRPGGKQSLAQSEWQRRLEAIGHLYIVATSLKDVEALIC